MTVELSAAAEHLAESEVVSGGASQSTTAGEKAGHGEVGTRLRVIDEAESLVGLALVVGGEAMLLFRRHVERRIDHAQGVKNRFLEVLIKGLAGDRLNEVPANIGRERIHPALAGGEMQRDVRELLDEGLERFGAVAVHALAAIDLVHRVVGGAVGEPARVAEDVAHGHRPFGGAGDHARAFTGNVDLLVLPFGDEARDRVVELEMALLVEGHEGDRGDRL